MLVLDALSPRLFFSVQTVRTLRQFAPEGSQHAVAPSVNHAGDWSPLIEPDDPLPRPCLRAQKPWDRDCPCCGTEPRRCFSLASLASYDYADFAAGGSGMSSGGGAVRAAAEATKVSNGLHISVQSAVGHELLPLLWTTTGRARMASSLLIRYVCAHVDVLLFNTFRPSRSLPPLFLPRRPLLRPRHPTPPTCGKGMAMCIVEICMHSQLTSWSSCIPLKWKELTVRLFSRVRATDLVAAVATDPSSLIVDVRPKHQCAALASPSMRATCRDGLLSSCCPL